MAEEEVLYQIPETILDNIYISLLESYERLDTGKANLKRCLNWLEGALNYEPPVCYLEDKKADFEKWSEEIIETLSEKLNIPTDILKMRFDK